MGCAPRYEAVITVVLPLLLVLLAALFCDGLLITSFLQNPVHWLSTSHTVLMMHGELSIDGSCLAKGSAASSGCWVVRLLKMSRSHPMISTAVQADLLADSHFYQEFRWLPFLIPVG